MIFSGRIMPRGIGRINPPMRGNPAKTRTWGTHAVPKNSIPRAQTGRARAKLPPYCWSILTPSIFAEWGLIKADTRRGVFRVKITGRCVCVFRATMSHAQV
jgi:hypothetical protein